MADGRSTPPERTWTAGGHRAWWPETIGTIVCLFCPGIAGTCCLCHETRRVTMEVALASTGASNVVRCGSCDACEEVEKPRYRTFREAFTARAKTSPEALSL